MPKAPEPQPRSRERLRSFLRRREGQPGLRFDIDRAALRDALMIILPALALLLLNAASEVHSPSGVLQGHKEFPAARETTFQLSKQAERYLEDGPAFLQRYLSFWVANLIERMLVLLVPFFFPFCCPRSRFFPRCGNGARKRAYSAGMARSNISKMI